MSSPRFQTGDRLRFNTVRFRTERLMRVRRLMAQLEKTVVALGTDWTPTDCTRLERLEENMWTLIDDLQREDLDVALGREKTDATVPATDRAA